PLVHLVALIGDGLAELLDRLGGGLQRALGKAQLVERAHHGRRQLALEVARDDAGLLVQRELAIAVRLACGVADRELEGQRNAGVDAGYVPSRGREEGVDPVAIER